jgi:hypothetical protein
MKKTKVYSVKVKEFVAVSDKAVRLVGFDGSSDIFPLSCIFGMDCDREKTRSLWVAAWILEKKELQYSTKKPGWFNPATDIVEPNISVTVEKHVPVKVEPVNTQPHAELTK